VWWRVQGRLLAAPKRWRYPTTVESKHNVPKDKNAFEKVYRGMNVLAV
jgi:hypothetical protein